eukprot:869481-Lingulodinium_polyedra.AAC.1
MHASSDTFSWSNTTASWSSREQNSWSFTDWPAADRFTSAFQRVCRERGAMSWSRMKRHTQSIARGPRTGKSCQLVS